MTDQTTLLCPINSVLKGSIEFVLAILIAHPMYFILRELGYLGKHNNDPISITYFVTYAFAVPTNFDHSYE